MTPRRTVSASAVARLQSRLKTAAAAAEPFSSVLREAGIVSLPWTLLSPARFFLLLGSEYLKNMVESQCVESLHDRRADIFCGWIPVYSERLSIFRRRGGGARMDDRSRALQGTAAVAGRAFTDRGPPKRSGSPDHGAVRLRASLTEAVQRRWISRLQPRLCRASSPVRDSQRQH